MTIGDKKKRLIDIVEVIKDKFNEAVYCINIFVSLCFVEEVILADDENENDYDGMNLLIFVYRVHA